MALPTLSDAVFGSGCGFIDSHVCTMTGKMALAITVLGSITTWKNGPSLNNLIPYKGPILHGSRANISWIFRYKKHMQNALLSLPLQCWYKNVKGGVLWYKFLFVTLSCLYLWFDNFINCAMLKSNRKWLMYIKSYHSFLLEYKHNNAYVFIT